MAGSAGAGVSAVGALFAAAGCEERDEPQQHDGSGQRGEQASERSHGDEPQQREEPAAQQAADNADGEVDEEPRAATLDDESGQPSGDQTNEQIPEKIHGQNEFW